MGHYKELRVDRSVQSVEAAPGGLAGEHLASCVVQRVAPHVEEHLDMLGYLGKHRVA